MAHGPHNPRPAVVAILVGVALGLVLPYVAVSISLTHTECLRGPVLGSTGPLVSPYFVVAAPPGGLVWYHYTVWSNWTVNGTTYSQSSAGFPEYPVNDTESDFGGYNWTLYSVTSRTVHGEGPSPSCPGSTLVAGETSWSCGGCQVAGPVAPGLGNRVVIPSAFPGSTDPSALLNGSYGSSPAFSFQWSGGPSGVQWTPPVSTPSPVQIAPYYNGSTLIGLGLKVQIPVTFFGVPITLGNGQTEVVEGSLQQDNPTTTGYNCAATYIFPISDDQGIWDAYTAGSSSAYPLGGLLFIQRSS